MASPNSSEILSEPISLENLILNSPETEPDLEDLILNSSPSEAEPDPESLERYETLRRRRAERAQKVAQQEAAAKEGTTLTGNTTETAQKIYENLTTTTIPVKDKHFRENVDRMERVVHDKQDKILSLVEDLSQDQSPEHRAENIERARELLNNREKITNVVSQVQNRPEMFNPEKFQLRTLEERDKIVKIAQSVSEPMKHKCRRDLRGVDRATAVDSYERNSKIKRTGLHATLFNCSNGKINHVLLDDALPPDKRLERVFPDNDGGQLVERLSVGDLEGIKVTVYLHRENTRMKTNRTASKLMNTPIKGDMLITAEVDLNPEIISQVMQILCQRK